MIWFVAPGVIAAALFLFSVWQGRAIEAAHPPQGRFVAVEGGRLHLTERHPQGEARASVVLLHGASGNQADVMEALGERLVQRGFHVVAVDRPGHGWSERPGGRGDASPARQAALVRRALERIGVQRAIVAGHSFAGSLVANFGVAHDDFALGLVFIAPASHPWPGGVTWYYHAAAAPVIGPLFTRIAVMPAALAVMDRVVASVFDPQTPPTDYAARTQLKLLLRPQTFEANAQDVALLNEYLKQNVRSYRTIRTPTHIVTGDTDSVVWTSIHSYGLEKDIPGARLTILPGIGHSVHHVEPDAVVSAVEDVAARAGLSSPGQ